MKVLPAANYQAQSQNNKKRDINFGMFIAKGKILKETEDLVKYYDPNEQIVQLLNRSNLHARKSECPEGEALPFYIFDNTREITEKVLEKMLKDYKKCRSQAEISNVTKKYLSSRTPFQQLLHNIFGGFSGLFSGKNS